MAAAIGTVPSANHKRTRRWVDQRTEEVMPVPYFHLVFTLPAEFRALVRANQKIAYAILFKAAAESPDQACGR